MKIAKVLSLLIYVVNATSLTNLQYEIDEQEWTLFKSIYNKFYENRKEEIFRKKVFFENKLKIAEHNKLYEKGHKTFTMKINQFGDLLPSEFVAKMGCLKMSDGSWNYTKTATFTKRVKDAPHSKDWREENLVTPVKNQGHCGSCWAFSATGALEGQYAMNNQNLISLSEQNLIDCSNSQGNHGCNGGMMDKAFKYVEENGGLADEDSYPYEGFEGSCRYDSGMGVITVQGTQHIPSGDEGALMEAVGTVGPVSVAIEATQEFKSYSSGVFYSDECSSKINHGVLIVGYGTDDSGQDYWIVKNSWGSTWGDGGYAFMSRNRDNNCAIASFASYPLL